ncbi:hypothetical protein LTR70_006612 [Exophiala xenobiotica]|uniref:DUF7918 domain-containing protein n=1 Tax=Lithohypha guttulata TaxID=1690604 RepID=A0ABR0K7Q0_9EURO|nr:hypothetical protein LTR24_005931 [Lithohypha guttulata]KAK5315870.1 hypothetical protein LTR70_006612 [Exophiala xenobiotica]
MPESGAYEISLLVNGQPLREYDPPDDDAETDSGKVTKYIEAIEGAEFHIKIKVAPRTQFPTSFKNVNVQVVVNLSTVSQFTSSATVTAKEGGHESEKVEVS